MKNIRYLTLAIITLTLMICGAITIASQTSSFTYQGKLNDNSLPASGTYDMQFALS